MTISFQSPYNDVRYTLKGNAVAQEFFYVDSVSGAVSLRKALSSDTQQNQFYQV